MKTYTADEIIKRYGRLIESHLRKEIMEEHDRHMAAIDNILQLVDVEYDWKNSPEGFENWLIRMHEEGHINDKFLYQLIGIERRKQTRNSKRYITESKVMVVEFEDHTPEQP